MKLYNLSRNERTSEKQDCVSYVREDRLTGPISKVIWGCPDSNTSFVPPGDQSVCHWREIGHDIVGVQMVDCVRVTKSGNSCFDARRVHDCV